MNTLMENEIYEQPIRLTKTREENLELVGLIAREVKAMRIKKIIVAARGSSDHAAHYFKYLTEVYSGIPVALAAMSVLSLYEGKLKFDHTLVIGVSQSGQAADVTNYLRVANEGGALTVGLTNDPSSPVASAATHHLFLGVGEEKSVAATKTCTAQMYLLGMLAAEIAHSSKLKYALKKVPSLIEKTLKQGEKIKKLASSLTGITDCVLLGRGYNLSSAYEGALKIQETCYIKARAYAISDFHHGPFASLGENDTVILLAPTGKTSKDAKEIYDKCANIKAKIIVFSDEKTTYPLKFILPKTVDENAPFVLTVALQLLALFISTCRGLNPDKPRGLNKVTVTL